MGGCYDVVHSFFFVTRRRQALLRESSHVRAIASGRRPQRPRQVETAAPRVGFTTYQQAKSSRRQPFRFRARPRRDDAADSAAVELVTATFVKMCDASRGVHTRSSAPDFAFIAIGRPSHAVNRTAALSAAPASGPTPRAATPPAPPTGVGVKYGTVGKMYCYRRLCLFKVRAFHRFLFFFIAVCTRRSGVARRVVWRPQIFRGHKNSETPSV